MRPEDGRRSRGRPLWAPWRLDYVRADEAGRCPFCDAVTAGDGHGSLVVERGARCLMILNAYPYASGHLMVLPHRYVGQLEELDTAEATELMP